ncbi:hypothetical protein [Kineococcus xinjiangensis]|nr:hypothetical protein [Kineococcus xinjiangensis]
MIPLVVVSVLMVAKGVTGLVDPTRPPNMITGVALPLLHAALITAWLVSLLLDRLLLPTAEGPALPPCQRHVDVRVAPDERPEAAKVSHRPR